MTVRPYKFSLIAIAVSAALAACGGGGDDAPAVAGASASTPTPTPAPTPSAPTTIPPGVTPVIVATPGLPPAPNVPLANVVVVNSDTPTYATTSQALRSFTLTNLFRREAQNGVDANRVEGVGSLTQSAALDTAAAAHRAYLIANPGAIGTPAARQDAVARATAAGFPYSYTAVFDTRSIVDVNGFVLPLIQGDICAKALFSSVFDLEQVMSGVRSIGIAVPEATPVVGGFCALTIGLADIATWQLPATGSVAVYPHPNKTETLKSSYGVINEPGLAGALGHPVFASVASIDALPVNTAGGTAIAPAQIVLQTFSLTAAASASGIAGPVAARVLAPRGTDITAVANAQYTDSFAFPTSFAVVPTAPLRDETDYTAVLNATVRGRPVTATWTFRTGTL
jgi:hypothetical protein